VGKISTFEYSPLCVTAGHVWPVYCNHVPECPISGRPDADPKSSIDYPGAPFETVLPLFLAARRWSLIGILRETADACSPGW
jgi:hypothetical protein